jgi:type IV secretion system protein VirD4
MQLPASDEIVMISGTHPVRAKKVRYFEDRRLTERVLPPPKSDTAAASLADQKPDGWSELPSPTKRVVVEAATKPDAVPAGKQQLVQCTDDPANAGVRREPELPAHEHIEPLKPEVLSEFSFDDAGHEPDDETVRLSELRRQLGGLARQASLDPADDLGL